MKRLSLAAAMTLGAGAFALAPAPSHATFAGNNGKIAFASNRNAQNDIYGMNVDGSQQTRLTTDLAQDQSPRWSPSGAQIAFASRRDGNFEIYKMNADGTNQTRLTTDPLRDDDPTWTADGSKIVFQRGGFSNGEIYVMNADGTAQRNLTNDPAPEFTPATSSRGRTIAFGSVRGGSGGLFTMQLDGSELTRITRTPGTDSSPNWSPTGNEMVFLHDVNGTDDDIYTVHADGSGLRRLTNTPARDELNPVRAPDGSKILFAGCGGDGGCQLYTINPDGSGEKQLTVGSFGPPPSAPYAESFDNNAVNPAFWTIFSPAGTSPPTLMAQDGELEVKIPADSVSDPSLGALAVQVASRCLIGGDFDFQVDYRLLDWPAQSGIVVALGGEPDNFVARAGGSSGSNDFYFGSFPPLGWATLDTTDLSGTLRLVRSGTTSTAYVLQGGVWTPILASATTPEDELITLTVYSTEATFGHQAAKVAFDNFKLNSGSFDTTTCGELRNNFPDWQALPRSG
jgi:Domain of unknown function (DUF5050)